MDRNQDAVIACPTSRWLQLRTTHSTPLAIDAALELAELTCSIVRQCSAWHGLLFSPSSSLPLAARVTYHVRSIMGLYRAFTQIPALLWSRSGSLLHSSSQFRGNSSFDHPYILYKIKGSSINVKSYPHYLILL
jgi:hypothetical protein